MRGRSGLRPVRCGLLPSGKEPVLFFRRPLSLALVAAALLFACGGERRVASRPGDTAFLDDFADTVRPSAPATRIVSLSPVTTEVLFALGAGARLVGRTHWDLYPPAAREVPDLGNGMQPNVEAIFGARPDLVVLYASASNRGAATALRRAGIATIAIRNDHVADFQRTVRWLARAVGDTTAAQAVIDSVERSLAAVRALQRLARRPTVFWHIWDSPVYTIGSGSFLDELVEAAGASNVFHDLAAPSPSVTMEEIVRRNPDYVIAGPVGASVIRSNPRWRAVPAVRAGRILVVDTALVGRPGIRMGEAARHLHRLVIGDSSR